MKKKHTRILLVDDEPDILEILEYNLSSEGYQVEKARNGVQALKKAIEWNPHLVLLDVMMPEMNGYDVAAILKNDPKTADIPIIILSIVQDIQRGLGIG
ncbi:MAG: response regulator, partial [Flavobacteriaceae bacterium]